MTMEAQRLAAILAQFPDCTMLVVGDYFLDRYLLIDRSLSELSLETNLEAYQVVQIRTDPGAAGTVTSNLRALGVQVIASGLIGDDGEGYELKRALAATGVEISPLVVSSARRTPTYTKPLLREPDGSVHELNRLDIKNRIPLPPETEGIIIAHLRDLVPRADGVIVVDQAQEPNCGAVTDRVREEIADLARQHPSKTFAVESRERIGLFRDVMVQMNLREARQAAGLERAEACGEELRRRSNRPVLITMAAQGVIAFDATGAIHIPAVKVTGPIDTVGAGDSVLAGSTAALCVGASLREAAEVGNLVASVTIRQIGCTGVATPDQVMQALDHAKHSG